MEDNAKHGNYDADVDSLSVFFPPIAVKAGLFLLTMHCILYVLLKYVVPYPGPWKELPGATSHNIVTFPLMIYCTWIGMRGWYYEPYLADLGPESRIFEIQTSGHTLGQVLYGAMVFWDIVTGLITPELRNPLMLGHHIGLAFVSGVTSGVFSNGVPLGTYHANFFFGVIELSSIFLGVMDFFHPRNKAWFEYMKNGTGPVFDALRLINEISRNLFAVTYIVLRTLYFPYVIFGTSVPDFHHAAMLPDEQRRGSSPYVHWAVCVFAILFTLLQFHWGVLVAQGVIKAYVPDKSKAGEKKGE